jgi:hypothetical protein
MWVSHGFRHLSGTAPCAHRARTPGFMTSLPHSFNIIGIVPID